MVAVKLSTVDVGSTREACNRRVSGCIVEMQNGFSAAVFHGSRVMHLTDFRGEIMRGLLNIAMLMLCFSQAGIAASLGTRPW
jgi:hypothetical protein